MSALGAASATRAYRLLRLPPSRAHTVEQPASFILPTRQAGVFRWCLRQGMRPVKPVTYMTIGEYREPNGAWIRRCSTRAASRRRAAKAACAATGVGHRPAAALRNHDTA